MVDTRSPAGRRLPGPTAQRLLDVRTPTGIAVSPDGSDLVFALAATVSERGESVPSDLWMIESEGVPVQLTSGESCDRSARWSPAGVRRGFLSERMLAGHAPPYTRRPR